MNRMIQATLLIVVVAACGCATVPTDATPEERAAVTRANFEDLQDMLASAEALYLPYVMHRDPEHYPERVVIVEKVKKTVSTQYALWQETGRCDLSSIRAAVSDVADGFEAYVRTDEDLDEDSRARRLQIIMLGRVAIDRILRQFDNLLSWAGGGALRVA